MGEIGFPRREYLYELKWWEIKSIIRGYNARQHAGWEQARLVAYCARFAMGSKEPIPDIDRWLRFSWEMKPARVSQEVIDELQAEMAEMNGLG